MTKFTQKWCLVAMLEEKPIGYEFDKGEWPLHVTFVGVHDVDWAKHELNEKLEILLRNTQPFKAIAKNIGNLGPDENSTKVTFIDKNEDLLSLHTKLVNLLNGFDAKYNNPEWNLVGYVPHSTVQKHVRLEKAEELFIDNIALIDMFPKNDGKRRKIVKIIRLG